MRTLLGSLAGALVLALLSPACQTREDHDPSGTPGVADVSEDREVRGDSGPPLDAADPADTAPPDAGPPPVCIPTPTAEALRIKGLQDDGTEILPGGRLVSAPEIAAELTGFPSNVITNAAGTVAYVVIAEMKSRRLQVVDLETPALLQDVEVVETLYGLALDEPRGRLYLSGGHDGFVLEFAVDADGMVTLEETWDVGIYVSGLAITPDGSRLFAGSFNKPFVAELDVAALGTGAAEVARHDTSAGIWDLRYLPGRDALLTTSLDGTAVHLISRKTGAVGTIDVGQTPLGLDVNADETRAWVAVSGTNDVVAIDLENWKESGRADAASDDLVTAEGTRLGRSNVNDVALSPDETRIYASRGADNAVSVFDATTLELLGAFPVSWYPTALAVSPDGGEVVVAQGQGFRTGGLLGVIPVEALDLAAEAAAVRANYHRGLEVFPFSCDGIFPIPTRPDLPSPIEHVVLVLKENKTFDCVFGGLEGADGDPELVRWGEEITPNQHAIARQFNISDNFYVESANSDQGHMLITAGMLNDFAERMVMESRRTDLQGFQVATQAASEGGNLFTHLLDHGVDLALYGEIVGMFVEAADGSVPFDFSDPAYPGGPVTNMDARDSAKAQYMIDRIEAGHFPAFTFILLPNNHTGGVAPGNPTPEAEVADNDEAVGMIVDFLSHSTHWEETVVFILEDDPQGCQDHVDTFRSYLLVASPWAKRGYVSHVNASYQSVFATIYRILGVPPLGRTDASAAPLWDFFTTDADLSPFDRIPRQVPAEKITAADTPGAEASMRMDFRGVDRNPDLGLVLDAYRLWRMGRISADEARRRIDAGIWPAPASWGDGPEARARMTEAAAFRREEAQEERFAFDRAMGQYRRYLEDRGAPPPPALPGAPLPEETIRAIMEGRIPVDEVPRLRGFRR
jgi:DNA-binding beta-propeller fold protein YncE